MLTNKPVGFWRAYSLATAIGIHLTNCILMERENGFAPYKAAWLSVSTTPHSQSNRIHFLRWLVITVVVMCGQTVFTQCPIVCHGSITVALGGDGTSTITTGMVVQNSIANCTGGFTINVADTLGNNYGNTVNGDLIGAFLTVTITHDDSGNNCVSDLSVIDNLAPEIICEEVFIYCNVPDSPDVIGYPTVTDNVSPLDSIDLSFTDVFTDLACFTMHGDSTVTAQIERTWEAIDESGNTATCVQNIWISRATLDMVVFPPNFDGFEQPPLECGMADPYNLATTGEPTINNYNLNNAGNCELVVSYTDQIVPECGGEIKVIRTWFVFDYCTDETRVNSQIILVNDTTPPSITCPANVSFNTYTNSCVTQVYLPQATASDDCSGVTITPNWAYGAGNGPFTAVPVGDYMIFYNAVDDCGNQSTCEITVSVIDDIPPTPICETQTFVTLQPDGTALIFAETFDDGSHDNCGIALFKASRNGDPFDNFVFVDCDDLGTPALVTLEVHDENGLTAQCTSTIIVEDEVAPEILCPADVNIGCEDDYDDINITGQPFATDNCEVASIANSDMVNLNSCGIGTITRTWIALDESGNGANCEQIITISDLTLMSVSFPSDILIYDCNVNTDPSVMGEPTVTGDDCEQVDITNTDYIFYTAFPSCYKVIRNWAVTDWCSFVPNDPNGAGFWEHTQIIEVLDSLPPLLTCPANFNAGIQNSECETFVNFDLATATDCSEEIVITNNSIYANGNAEDASGVYPMGTHIITFTAEDGCGNSSECTTIVSVTDAEPPNPVCNNGVSVTIQQNGMVTLTPSLIEAGSSDNCSAYADLIFQVSPNTFTCQDLGNQVVTLTVTDKFNNSAFCQTNIDVQDNLLVCPPDSSNVTVAGKLNSESGVPLSQKLVGLSGGISTAMHTNVDGTFAFQSLPTGQDYTITPTYDTEPLNGVTTFDLVLIRKHILNVLVLDSPYKIIAADANKSNSITTLDMVEIRKLILNVIPTFTNNTSWRFVDADFVFSNPTNPFLTSFPEDIELFNIPASQWNQDFVGIKIGDVNDSAIPSSFDDNEDAEERSGETLTFKVENLEIKAGFEYHIPFRTTHFENILGYQFTIEFDANALEFLSVEADNLMELRSQNFGLSLLDAGVITTNWENIFDQNLKNDEKLFTLNFIAKSDGWLSDLLHINSKYTKAEAYTGSFVSESRELNLMGVALQFEEPTKSNFSLFQNHPNPFAQKTTIGFNLPEASETTLKIYDLLGNVIAIYEGNYAQGYHELEIDLSDKFYQAGILLCELKAPGFKSQIKKMTILK